MNYRNTYHILLMGGMAPIPMEVCADSVTLDDGAYCFKRKRIAVAFYPIKTTVIKDIEKNPDYVEPERPDRGRPAGVLHAFRG
jgi:hypothetical protein